jgi:deoxycytidine triphosphate deaminase
MKLLQGQELKDFVIRHVIGAEEGLIGQYGLDIRVSDEIWTEKSPGGWEKAHTLTKTGMPDLWVQVQAPDWGFTMRPGQMVKALTREEFKMPDSVLGRLNLRSWAAQSGLGHTASLVLQPGWQGRLILELVNVLKHRELLVEPETALAEVQFFRV